MLKLLPPHTLVVVHMLQKSEHSSQEDHTRARARTHTQIWHRSSMLSFCFVTRGYHIIVITIMIWEQIHQSDLAVIVLPTYWNQRNIGDLR